MTEDELRAIEARTFAAYEDGPLEQEQRDDVLALVAEVRRLREERGCLTCGAPPACGCPRTCTEANPPAEIERAARIGHMGGLSTTRLQEIARAAPPNPFTKLSVEEARMLAAKYEHGVCVSCGEPLGCAGLCDVCDDPDR